MRPLIICLLSLFGLPLLAQLPTDSLLAKADYSYEEKHYKPALELYEKAWKQAKKQDQQYQGFRALQGICYVLADSISESAALKRMEVELPSMFQRGETPDTIWYNLLLTRSYLYYYLPNYSMALADLEEAIAINEKQNWYPKIAAYAYRMAGNIYMPRLDYDKAIPAYKKAMKLDPGREISMRASIAGCYIFLENYDEAWKHCRVALKSPQLYKNPSHTAMLFLALSSLTEHEGELVISQKYAEQAAQLFIQSEEPGDAANCYVQLGNLAVQRGKQAQATLNFNKAVELIRKDSLAKDREVAKILTQIGNHYAFQNELNKALDYYQKAMVQVFPGFNSLNINDNPPLDNTPLESWAMTAPARKAEALLLRYKKSQHPADLRNAIHCFELAIAGHHNLIDTYGSNEARLYLSDYNFNKYENTIDAYFLLWQQTAERQALSRIFELMEESKSAVLRDAIYRRRALILSDIPEATRAREISLRHDIAQLTGQRLEIAMGESEKDRKALDSLDEKLGDLRREYNRLLSKNKAIWRNFYQTRQKTTLADVQSHLKNNDLFLEYCWGEKHVYILAVQQHAVKLYRLAMDAPVEKSITRFIEYFTSPDRINADPAAYFNAAKTCFDLVFPQELQAEYPWLANAQNGAPPPRLILVPDGVLYALPFEALLTQAYAGSSYAQAPYLLKNVALHYGWSADLLWTDFEGRRSGPWVQFSPGFAGGEMGLAPLPYSLDETGRSGFKKWLNHNATVDHFTDLASNAYILHLSTHAEAGSDTSDARIAFFDKFLSLSQVYALNMGANLAVLSACETHTGAFARGEGAMSLARGFAYAGVQSIIASLWPVNERSTSLIFAQFYQHIANKKSKSAAMREAKLDYINMQEMPNARRSPFYWAGFVFIGQDGHLSPPTNWLNRLLLALGISAPLVAGIWYWRRRARAAAAVLLLLGLGAAAKGAENTTAAQAAEAYRSANYDESIRLYESMLQKGQSSAELHYNLGNAYYRAGRIGGAILHYEKAALLAPADKAIKNNLQVARDRVTDNVAPLPAFFLSRWLYALAAVFSPAIWNIIGLVLFWSGAIFGIIYHWSDASRLKRLSIGMGIIATFMAILPFALAKSRAAILQHSGYAVVMREGSQLRSAPEAQQNLANLHEGYKVELLDAIGEWRKVQLPNGDEGWVEARVLAEI